MMNKWPQAIEEFEKAYQIDSSDVTLVYQLANAKSYMATMTSMTSGRLNPESERLFAKSSLSKIYAPHTGHFCPSTEIPI